MDNETREILMDLIHALIHSDTKDYTDGVVNHSHALFDDVDRDSLCDIYDKLKDV